MSSDFIQFSGCDEVFVCETQDEKDFDFFSDSSTASYVPAAQELPFDTVLPHRLAVRQASISSRRWDASVGTMTEPEREALVRVMAAMDFSVACTGLPDVSISLSLSDIIYATRQVPYFLPGGNKTNSTTAIWGGAANMPQQALGAMTYWNGVTYVGKGDFVCDAIAPKIDGVPAYPFTLTRDGRAYHYLWIHRFGAYHVYQVPEALQGPLEIRKIASGRYAIYSRVQYRPVTIGGDIYTFVLVEPLPLPSYRRLKHMDVADGYILISGLCEYKVKNRMTIDLHFCDTIGKTSDGVMMMEADVPDGVHEVDFSTREIIRPRPDKRAGNTHKTVQAVICAPRTTQLFTCLSVLFANKDMPVIESKHIYRPIRKIAHPGVPWGARHLLEDATLTLWDARRVLRGAGVARNSNATWDPVNKRWTTWTWAISVQNGRAWVARRTGSKRSFWGKQRPRALY